MWIDKLQERISSLYSPIAIIRSEDDKRVKELINLLNSGIPLNYLHGKAIKHISIYNGVEIKKYRDGKPSGTDEVGDGFFDNPVKTFVSGGEDDSIFIMHLAPIKDDMISTLIAYSRKTELFSKNKYIIIFTEDEGVIRRLADSVNLIDVPLSTADERKSLLEAFKEAMKSANINPNFEDEGAIIRATSGLNLMQFESLLYESVIKFHIREGAEKIPASWFAKRKIELININETFSLSHPKHGLDAFASPQVIKDYIQRRIINVVKDYLRAREIGLKFPDGLLLFGMQGTGKTWLARAIANEINIPFVEFRISSVLNMYLGETEKNVERMIKVLEAIQPAVLFIDEIDAIGMQRGEINESATTRRMMNRLMSWLAEEDKQVLVIGSTNTPQQMDKAFIRAGRFSFKIPLLLPNFETRRQIFEIHLKLRNARYKDIDLNDLARRSAYYSGAEIVKVLDDALFFAFDSGRDYLTMEDFDEAFKDMVVDVESNKAQQKEYLQLAEKYGTNRKIIEVYEENQSKTEKVEMLRSFLKGD